MATVCKHKLGLLSLRDCKAPAVAKCENCGRPVCQEHQKVLSIDQKDSVLCVECYLERASETDTPHDHNEYQRHSFYRSTGYRPYYYGQSQRYGQEDYEYFDHEAETAFATEEADDMMDAEDFQDS